MKDVCNESRRATLKTLGGMAAGAALAGAAPAALEAGAESIAGGQEPQAGSLAAEAVARFSRGHNCAQAVFTPCAERLGVDPATAKKVAAGFGGGMYMGGVCGAVAGGIMAIGLKAGAADGKASETTRLVTVFTDRFKAEHKAVTCSELTGVDWNKPIVRKLAQGTPPTPEDAQAIKEAFGGRSLKDFLANCQGYVRDAAAAVDEILAEKAK